MYSSAVETPSELSDFTPANLVKFDGVVSSAVPVTLRKFRPSSTVTEVSASGISILSK